MSRYLDEILEEIERDFNISREDLNLISEVDEKSRYIDSITYLDLLDSYIESALNYKASYGILALKEMQLPPLQFTIDLKIAYNYDKFKLKNILLKARSANILLKVS